MKNFILFTFCILGFLFTSCTKDDVPASKQAEGTWNLVGLNYSGTTITETFGAVISSEISGVGKNFNAELTFNLDGTYARSGSYTAVVTTTTFGQSTVQTLDISDFDDDGLYTLDEEVDPIKITFSDKNGVMSTGTISSLTDNEMKFSINSIQEMTTPGNLGTVKTDITANYTLTK